MLPLEISNKCSMNPTEGFTAQCRFPPASQMPALSIHPQSLVVPNWSPKGIQSPDHWWGMALLVQVQETRMQLIRERATFQSSLQLVYSLSYFDTTPVSALAWKPPQHSRWQSICITNVLKGQPMAVAVVCRCGWDRRGGRDLLLGQQCSHQSPTLLGKRPTP